MVRGVHAGDSIHHTGNQHFPMQRRTSDEQVQAPEEQVISPRCKPKCQEPARSPKKKLQVEKYKSARTKLTSRLKQLFNYYFVIIICHLICINRQVRRTSYSLIHFLHLSIWVRRTYLILEKWRTFGEALGFGSHLYFGIGILSWQVIWLV